MKTFFTWIASFLINSKSKGYALQVAQFAALKAFLILLVVTILPYALFQFGSYLFLKFLDVFSAQTAGFSPIVLNTTGMLAWLLDSFSVPYCMTIIMSAFVIRYTIRMYRFLIFWR